jgi:predicted amidophosphoribosyltransferase
METYNHFVYVPTRYEANESEKRVRNFIFKFKDGDKQAIEYAAKLVADKLGYRPNTIFVCIPASTNKRNIERYEYFSYLVCKATGMLNAFSHVHITGERTALHNIKPGSAREDNQRIIIDTDFFDGKQVVIFDDIITRGRTLENFSAILKDANAQILGGYFLARTFHC